MAQMGSKEKGERNYGIDILRIVSMFMVCVLHSNMFGGYGEITFLKEPLEYLGWFGSQSLCIIAVNLYAMITGYVCITSKQHIGRYVTLWVQTAFYTMVLYALGVFLMCHGYMLPHGITGMISDMLTVPLAGAYWYFNAYTGLFFLMPFLNSLLQKLPRYDYIKLLLVLMVILPIMNMTEMGSKRLYQGSYNLAWLGALYVLGAFIRLHPFKIRKSICLALYFLATLCTLTEQLLTNTYHSFTFATLPNIIASLAVFLIFSNMGIRQNRVKAFICSAASLTFGIYLVQCHPVIQQAFHIIGRKLAAIQGHPVWMPLAGGLCIFLGCAAVEWMRRCAFKLLHVSKLEGRLSAFLSAAGRFACDKALLIVSRKP